jgi:hypothetical protein
MSAPIALLDAATQGGGPAVANVLKRFPLLARQDRVPASQEIALMSAEDIGQFGPMWFHRRKSSSRESSGLAVARTATSATCR